MREWADDTRPVDCIQYITDVAMAQGADEKDHPRRDGPERDGAAHSTVRTLFISASMSPDGMGLPVTDSTDRT